jgi:gliding motility-associated lipoprotein GldH
MKIKNLSSIIMAIVIILAGLTSCDNSKIYEENFNVDSEGWHSDDIKDFKFTIEDTLSPLSLFVNVRTSTDYKYSNLYIFLHSKYPNGEKNKDTLEFILADPMGKWYGESSGTVVEFKGMISTGGRFAQAGEYMFSIEHAMREEVLAEVIDVGFRVELAD